MSRLILPRIWQTLNNPNFGFMNTFSQSIYKSETQDKYLLPDIRRGSIIFVASDYSGENDLADYQSLSFLFADLEGCAIWEKRRQQLRQQFLPQGRRMAFKNLNDKHRKRALASFLSAANTIPGLSASILIDKRIESLFEDSDKLNRSRPELQPYAHWTTASLEKMFRVVHLVSLFVAGLSRQNQDVMWITDEDDIAANEARLRELTTIWGNTLSQYLAHNLRHLRCGTTKSDNGSRNIEDLASIPDLVAGCLAEVITAQRKENRFPQSQLIVPPPENLAAKTIEIMNWFATNREPLKRLVYVIEPIENSTSLSLKRLRFHGSQDYQR